MLRKIQFPKFLLTTPVKIYSTSINEDGEPVEELIFDGLCNYTEESKQILDSDRRLITLSGTLVVEGDICPDKLIEGYVEVAFISLKESQKYISNSSEVSSDGWLIYDESIDSEFYIRGHRKNIYKTSRPRNPDGSVFSTELELS